MIKIPHVEILPVEDGYLAVCGFELVALQAERVVAPPGTEMRPADRLAASHAASARLLAVLTAASVPLWVELRLQVNPSLEPLEPGNIELCLLLRSSATERNFALENVLSAAVSCTGVLSSLLPAAEFATIEDAARLERVLRPYCGGRTLAVDRLRGPVALDSPFAVAAHRPGFQQAPAPAKGGTTLEHLSSWVFAADDWNALLDTMLSTTAPQRIVVRFAAHPDSSMELDRLVQVISQCEQFLSCGPGNRTVLTSRAAAIRDASVARLVSLRTGALCGEVLLESPSSADPLTARLLGQSISCPVGQSGSTAASGGFDIRDVPPDPSDTRAVSPPFTYEEAACAFRLPLILGESDCGLPVRRYRTIAAHLPSACDPAPLVIGVNQHRGVERPISLDISHRLRHTVLFGMTGCGKSTMLETMFLQDVRAGRGACLIDPHGDLADSVLARFPSSRANDLMVIDLEDRARPIPMNLLAWNTIEERDRIIDDFYTALLRIYRNPDMFGPVFETNFRAGMKLLMGDRQDRSFHGTLLEFPKLFLNAAFRRHLMQEIEDDQLRDYMTEAERVTYGDHKIENLSPYITSKLGRFLHDQSLRRILGHGAMVLNPTEIMEEGRVVVMKLGRGRFGALACDLLTSQIVSRFRTAAMARACLPANRRTPYFLYVDEFGALSGDETFAQLLSESRKYALGLVLASQYAAQLRPFDGGNNALSAVLGNVGTVISFRVGAEDAPLLASLFASAVSPQDLLESPNWQGYMRMHLDRRLVRPFSFHSVPDSAPADPATARRLRSASRGRWGVPAAECDACATARARRIQELS